MSYSDLNIICYDNKFYPQEYNNEILFEDFVNGSVNGFLTELEAVEDFGVSMNLVSNEDEVKDIIIYTMQELSKGALINLINDESAVSEFVSNELDYLCSEGDIHDVQLQNYCIEISNDEVLNILKSKYN